uniref:Uncharacterized protein n=1 Tax=Trieres chinensis TaxID=1514140 RepID=A0A7S1ZPF4_TRICV|mmetsp:Transcript_29654/g.60561  ORF Transcript_29654/g.60561 Transcript_29654/m.60561 type:complete len:116 (+) Transcript_29654:81-428(+)
MPLFSAAAIASENVTLLNCRLCELLSNLRALSDSNEQIAESLRTDCPGDPDLIEAAAENVGVIERKKAEVEAIVAEIRRRGLEAEVPEDVRRMGKQDGDDGKGSKEEAKEEGYFL